MVYCMKGVYYKDKKRVLVSGVCVCARAGARARGRAGAKARAFDMRVLRFFVRGSRLFFCGL
jgi:hypothetical protein